MQKREVPRDVPGEKKHFDFHITNFPFLSSNISSSPAYGVFMSQLIRYARASSSNECFILRAVRLSNQLLGQGYVKERSLSSLRKFYGRNFAFRTSLGTSVFAWIIRKFKRDGTEWPEGFIVLW